MDAFILHLHPVGFCDLNSTIPAVTINNPIFDIIIGLGQYRFYRVAYGFSLLNATVMILTNGLLLMLLSSFRSKVKSPIIIPHDNIGLSDPYSE